MKSYGKRTPNSTENK